MEIIEGDENDQVSNKNETAFDFKRANSAQTVESLKSVDDEKIKLLKRIDKPLASVSVGPTSTAEVVKKKLETQLKSIFKQPSSGSSLSNQPIKSSLSMYTNNNNQTRADEEVNRIEKTSESRKKELLNQVNNHSFKDIELIRIESRIEPTDLRDLKAAHDAKIPKVNTLYNVNVLKKPYSMKWLRNRRLTLFLQSELYSEFKLAMILAQFSLFNKDAGRALN